MKEIKVIVHKKLGKINARKKGHSFELQIVNLLKEYGYEAVSSRSESKNLDDQKVDIVDDTPFYFQCKAVERMKESYHDILASMKKGKVPVILHKRNNKGTVAVLDIKDFCDLLLYKKK